MVLAISYQEGNMILLRIQTGKMNRVCHGIIFKDGEARLDNGLFKKAQHVCKYWPVKIVTREEFENQGVNPADVDAPPVAPPVDPSDIDPPDDTEPPVDPQPTWGGGE